METNSIMELQFGGSAPRRRLGSRKSTRKSTRGCGKSGGGKSGGSITKLKADMHKAIRGHGIPVKYSKQAMQMLEGAGFFDTIKGLWNKGMSIFNKGKNIYNQHKGTIDEIVNVGTKYAPKVMDIVRQVRGGKKVKRVGAKRVLSTGQKAYFAKLRAIQAKNHCTYGEAMQIYKRTRR